jgi:E3 ubiquitin-protein ligase UBR1
LSTNPDIPDELVMALYHSIIVCLEFVIGTMEHSFLPSELGNLPKDLDEMLAGVGGTAESEEKRCLGPWSVAFYSDDKHVLKEIARQIRDALGVSLETAEQLAKEAEQLVSGLTDILTRAI